MIKIGDTIKITVQLKDSFISIKGIYFNIYDGISYFVYTIFNEKKFKKFNNINLSLIFEELDIKRIFIKNAYCLITTAKSSRMVLHEKNTYFKKRFSPFSFFKLY